MLGITVGPVWSQYSGPFDVQRLRQILSVKPSGAVSQVSPVQASVDDVPIRLGAPQVIHLQYAHPSDLKPVLVELLPNARISADLRNRQLVIVADRSDFRAARQLVETLDVPPDQVQIQVQLIESTQSFSDTLQSWLLTLQNGVSWQIDMSQFALIPNATVGGFLQALTAKGGAVTVAKPSITVRDNAKAVVRVGDQVPYLTTVVTDRAVNTQVNQADTGVQLEVIPRVSDTDDVQVDLVVTLASIRGYRDLGGASYPVLTSRRVETQVSISSGNTLIIAGLVDHQTRTSQTEVPGLATVPVLGGLFRGETTERSSSDIVILVSPTIIRAKKKEALR